MSLFKHIWADNGDYISKIYTGTGATTSSTTRKGKGGIFGAIDHKMKSLGRFYKGHYIDNDKQRAINTILGFDQIIDVGTPENAVRHLEKHYTDIKDINITIITWNVNISYDNVDIGVVENLMGKVDLSETDVIFIGLQDTLKLKLMSIFSNDAKAVKQRWESVFSSYMKDHHSDTFSRLTCDSNVDLITISYIRSNLIQDLSKCSVDEIKFTVMKSSMKKSAIVTRFNICNSSLCFINAHLTTGREGLAGRLSDLKKIFSEAFQKDKLGRIKSEDVEGSDKIFILGNLNFKLEMLDHTVREKLLEYGALKKQSDEDECEELLTEMLKSDQLLNLLKDDSSFLGRFCEAPIFFPPTYKFRHDSYIYQDDPKSTPGW